MKNRYTLYFAVLVLGFVLAVVSSSIIQPVEGQTSQVSPNVLVKQQLHQESHIQYPDDVTEQFISNLPSRINLKNNTNARADKGVERDALGRPIYYPDRITVKLKQGVVFDKTALSTRQMGIKSLDQKFSKIKVGQIKKQFSVAKAPVKADLPDLSRILSVSVPEGTDIHAASRLLMQDPSVEYAEPVPVMYLDRVPSDTLYSAMQHLAQIKAEQAWDLHTGEAGDSVVIIGICDSGVDWDHPDLIDNLWQNLNEDADGDGHVIEWADTAWVLDPGDINGLDDDDNGFMDDLIGWNFMADDLGNQSNNPGQAMYHGSHVTGLAAASTNNVTGIASISWNVKFLPTSHGLADEDNSIYNPFNGVIYLAENGADIINCSWGGSGYYRAGEEVFEYATQLGCILVASAGNDNSDNYHYPSDYPHVVSVAAVANTDEKASYSTYGIGVDVSAPGGDIEVDGGVLSTVPDDTYAFEQGTSMATPLTSGLVALIKSQHPMWTNERIISQLLGTTDKIDAQNPDYANQLGSGRINAFRAVSEQNVPPAASLELALFRVLPPTDFDGNGSIQAGDTASLNLEIRNFAQFRASQNVVFTLVSGDPDVEIIQAAYTADVEADDYVLLKNAFEIRAKENIVPHFAEFSLSVTDTDPVIMQDMSFQLMIGHAGILVWEGAEAGIDMSGTFIANFLDRQGIDYFYASTFPFSLIGYDIVFLSFGSSYNVDDYVVFDDNMAAAVADYLNNGGKLYLEGNEALGYYQKGNTELYDLLGLEQVIEGPSEYSFVENMVGKSGSVAEGMAFNDNVQLSPVWIDKFTHNESGKSALEEAFYGVVAVQNEGSMGQKSFCFSYSLADMVDNAYPSSRVNLLSRILKYFDVDVSLAADMGSDLTSGHAPLTIQFSDLTYTPTDKSATSWAWDLDGDGKKDSNEQNPEFTYNNPGIYDVEFTVTNASGTQTRSFPKKISVFDGESALAFDGMNNSSHVFAMPDSSMDVDWALTLEAWIKPSGWGAAEQVGYGRIFDKESSFSLYLHDSGYPGYATQSLVFGITHSDGTFSRFNTPESSIKLNKWQHVAVTYNGYSGNAKMFINGVEQEVTVVFPPSGEIGNNSEDYLLIGNNLSLDRTFEGIIDEARFWNLVRPAILIENMYDKRLRGNEGGLIGYWNMNEANGYILADQSKPENTAIAYRTEWVQGASEAAITDVADQQLTSITPETFVLGNNYPNPFNPVTMIPFALPYQAHVKVELLNVRGRRIETLADRVYQAGWHQIEFNGSSLGSGVYVIHFKTKEFTQSKKILLMK